MKRLLAISVLISSLYCAVSPEATAADKPILDVLKMREIPAGSYDVQLQSEGKNETVTLSIKNNRATFVKPTSSKFDGLSGEFELIGNGVFLARLASKAVELSQLLELSRILDLRLLDLLGETEAEVREPLSFPELAALIRREITNGRITEDRIGWDLSEFWEEPMIGMEYPVSFLKIVGEDVGFDWRRPLLYYQRNAEHCAAPNGRPATQSGNSNVTKGGHR